MKDEYDFLNAEQSKFFVPVEDIQMPVYLDKDVMQFLNKQCDFNAEKLSLLRLLQNYCVLKGYVRINPCSAMIFLKRCSLTG
jgi:hypothetical protein